MPAPEAASTIRTVRAPTRLRASDAKAESTAKQAIDPRPTPTTSGTGRSAPAVDAAENTAAHERIVIGLDAVAASDVAKARRGEATSAVASPPRRTRNALHKVRTPTAALLTFFAVGVAARPADAAHTYGHGKAEHLAALAEAAILVLASVFVAARAIMRLTGSSHGHVHAAWYALAVLVVVIVIDASRAFV